MSASAQKPVYPNHHDIEVVVHSDGQLQHRILVVDEQAHILRVLRLNLTRLGYVVDMALSSDCALNLMREHHYNVLVITSDLPDMNARQLCEKIEHQFAQSSPLILVGVGHDESWADNAACVERLMLPVSLKRIVVRLSEEFAGHG